MVRRRQESAVPTGVYLIFVCCLTVAAAAPESETIRPGRIHEEDPPVPPHVHFAAPLNNVTIPLGQEAIFRCTISELLHSDQLGLEFFRLNPETLLSHEYNILQRELFRLNPNTPLSHYHNNIVNPSETRLRISTNTWQEWNLHIKNVQSSDAGEYACRIRTAPISETRGYLHVVGA